MHEIRTIVKGNSIEAIKIIDQNLFYAVVELNEKELFLYETNFLQKLCLNALRNIYINNVFNRLPVLFADSLKYELREMSKSGKQCYGVMYAGIQVKTDEVEVCTAGDIRVHILKDNSIIARTRDHNLVDDAPDDLPEFVRSSRKEVLTGAITRIISAESNKEPEIKVWSLKECSSLFVCTSNFHGYREPEQYLSILQNPMNYVGATIKTGSWLITQVDVS